ncbi:unnamed protein product [Cuscuta campestris]|uniref:Pectin acetylesterase n=1 Tax=Cuscuta campestris TaxID=132261 RepID=A0A484NB04_9ASTE|nr:unnamed protein product [Cuscuta campestris]
MFSWLVCVMVVFHFPKVSAGCVDGPVAPNASLTLLKADVNDPMAPDLCNWNRIFVRYCDRSSFTGGVQGADPAILSGSSAGGLAEIIHCDCFRSFLPASARVKCLVDSAFFLNPRQKI